MVETQVLAGQRGAYRLVQPFPTIQVPVTVQALLAARINRLSIENKQLLAGDLQAALAAGEGALTIFEAHGNIWWACRTLWHLSTITSPLGEWRKSLEYCHRALEYGQTVDDLRLKVVGWWRTGSTHLQRGDPKTGLQCCDEALVLSPIPFDAATIKAVRGHG
jgi:hypothetical protein